MSVIHNDLLLTGDDGYNLTKSLRFRSSASAYLSRTPASAGNRQTWTWSGWVKRGALGSQQKLFFAGSSGTSFTSFEFISADTFQIYSYNGAQDAYLVTSQVFRDPSAWYHIVVVFDTTNATSSNRIKVYVNGSQVTAFSTNSQPSQNYQGLINNNVAHAFCRDNANANNYFDGYVAETNFIDGQALTPSSFGSTNAQTGVWQPKKYSGTYGTNGFYLPFTDVALTSGSNAGLGKDFSGNGNYWNTNNISVTSGSTYDSMTDVPTLTSATASNFCVMNPNDTGRQVVKDGNLTVSYPSVAGGISRGSLGVSSGKWYWEINVVAAAGSDAEGVGIANSSINVFTAWLGEANSWAYWSAGNKYTNGSSSSYGASWTTGDVIGVALDMDAGTLTFYKNNTSQGIAFSGLTGTMFPAVTAYNPNTTVFGMNFGQRPFAYTPPTGYVALNTYNLPTPTIGATASSQAGKYMNQVLYTGNSSTQSISGVGFQPDFVWIKPRNTASYGHKLFDSVRGATNFLASEATDAEGTVSGLTSFNSDGFSLGSYAGTNSSSYNFVAWNWKANGSGSSNTAGSITSTVSANTSSGFSVVTYTGNGTIGSTVGHGLGVAPKMIVVKQRSSTESWIVYHASLGNTKFLVLNNTDAAGTSNNAWNSTSPTSSVFTIGAGAGWGTNTSSGTYVAYCFAPVSGYSAFGSYVGNGSSDGSFVFCGFKPKFILIKRTDAINDWVMYDTTRNTYNEIKDYLEPNTSDAESVGTNDRNIDVLSNGFKLRYSGNAINGSGGTFVYAAFAEHPFKYSLGR